MYHVILTLFVLVFTGDETDDFICLSVTLELIVTTTVGIISHLCFELHVYLNIVIAVKI